MTLPLVLIAATALGAADLKKDLTFYAGFNGGTEASVALGDKRIYSAASYKEQASASPGLQGTDVELAKGAGRSGDALRFLKKNNKAVFYRAGKNVAFDAANWSGTVSLFLNLSPESELEPGFCDPIQITDKAYNDSAIWVDFTKDDAPRHFRLGVFGALKAWNPQNTPSDKNPDFLNRLVVMKKHPFAKGKWTHVAIAWSRLGSGEGEASLYVNGELQGRSQGIKELFDWNIANGAVRLGVAYVGLMDDISFYRRALSQAEIRSLRR
ncbi:MAG: LamG domain-containing protein [Bryobacterales bacterium]|nr:LamG domain-containing protein [Bryobacterales bacterium]